MSDLLLGLAIIVGMYLAGTLIQIARRLWQMSDQEKRGLEERQARRLHNERMIRFWRSGGKKP